MSISGICKTPVALISSEATLKQAAILMKARNVGTLIIVDGNEKPIGLLTDRDIVIRGVLRDVSFEEETVEEIMTKELVTISDQADLTDVLALMRSSHVRRVIVIDEDRRLTGIISADDVMKCLMKQFNMLNDVYNSPEKIDENLFSRDFTRMA